MCRLGAVVIGYRAVVSCASSGGIIVWPGRVPSAADTSRKTQQEVQSELMAFADRYFATSLEAARTLENVLETPQSRYTAAAARLLVADRDHRHRGQPQSRGALLDMTVFVTLKRIVAEDYWIPEVYGERAAPVLDAYREIEEDIWDLAASVYSPEQLDELRELIADWRAQHPDTVAVDFMRLTEIGDARKVQNLIDAGSPGGMLAPVKEANRNIEEMRLLAERLTFMVDEDAARGQPPGGDGLGEAGGPARGPAAARGLPDLCRGIGSCGRGLCDPCGGPPRRAPSRHRTDTDRSGR